MVLVVISDDLCKVFEDKALSWFTYSLKLKYPLDGVLSKLTQNDNKEIILNA